MDLHNKLQTTLAAGKGAPDVALVEQGQFPRYSTGGVSMILLQPPYNAGKYKEEVSEYNWNRWSSIHGSQLLGMPWNVTPSVTYYRADIFEELAFHLIRLSLVNISKTQITSSHSHRRSKPTASGQWNGVIRQCIGWATA